MEQKIDKLLGEIAELRSSIREFDFRLQTIEKDLRNEIKIEHQRLDYNIDDVRRKASLSERVLFSAMGIILMAVLGYIVSYFLNPPA